jgi:SAM-dependent methyltransferase
MQWYGTILTRVHSYLPTGSILEIACGYGRWSDFLKDMCERFVAIDISNECVEACRKRFAQSQHMEFHVTDGKSLDMIPDASIDFVFSFDSLVHADKAVLEAYISQLPRILKEDGVAFVHHSNLGEYSDLYAKIHKIPRLEKMLGRLRILDKSLRWRDFSVSAEMIEVCTQRYGLKCISQEIIPWRTRRTKIDCFSTIVRSASSLARDNRVWRNGKFMREVKYLLRLSRLYNITWPRARNG